MKRTYLNLFTVAALAGAASMLPSCSDKEGCTDSSAVNFDSEADTDNGSCLYDAAVKSGSLTADETWTNDRIYFLEGKVVVPDGVTLTIEAGTIIKGKEGQETLASALVVARGGKLIAVGTADMPIIFTSELDNIALGEKVGTNLTRTDNEKWGGVAILGRAPISAEFGDTEANLEGIPVGDGFGQYGGSNAADNSGTLAYVSIRHGGVSIGEGNELNALTLGGVGSGTSISNIEIYATLDDGIECFGGTVSISKALVYFQGDDGIDLDQNYSGTISEFAVIHGDGIGTDEGLEIDGPEGTTNTTGMFTLTNGICKSVGTTEGSAGDFKSKAQGTVSNVTFDYSSIAGGKKVKFRASYNADCTNKSDAFSYLFTTPAKLVFNACNYVGVSVYENADPAVCVAENAANQLLAAALLDGTGVGGSVNISTLFASWTAAGVRGEL